ncbi:hypothetical protein Taro_033204 [Colocasia esculenta]|uniref:Uncharacterized protein n=1 Tax=Colocasia esculenta TaxID=4460 RepID=A0A843W8C3_COLES|nr:hypothetical protein [Colocasia esculenta]
MGLRVERQLDLSSVAARLRGSPVWFVRVSNWCREPVDVARVWRFSTVARSFPTEPVTREAHPYLLPGEGDQEISRPSSSGGSAPPVVLVDANLCDLQNIGLPEDSFLSSFSLSLALFSCSWLPYYFQRLQKVNWRIVEREAVTNWRRKRRSEV